MGNNSCLAKVGLSYSSFEYGDLKLSADKLRPGEKIMVTVQFKNTGKYAATEIVQLYIMDVAASVTRPIKELKAFQRIALKPGESRNIDFELNARDVAFWNTHMQFGAEAGRFDVMIGSSSADDDLKNASFILIESQQLKY